MISDTLGTRTWIFAEKCNKIVASASKMVENKAGKVFAHFSVE